MHPSGAVGQFTLTPTRHGRNKVPNQCVVDFTYQSYSATYPRIFDTYALTNKTISGPGLQPLTWTTVYPQETSSWAPCDPCVGTKHVDVTDPAGHKTRYTFGTLYHETEGQVQKVEVFDKSGPLLRSTATAYFEPIAPRGVSDQHRGDGDMSARVVEANRKTISQQGVDFVWDAGTNFNEYAQAVQITRSSSLNPGRTEVTVYNNNTARWVLGQIKTVTAVLDGSTSKEMVNNVYDDAGQPISVSKFGFLQHTMTYYADGTLQSRTDGRGNPTRFSDYKRGLARNVSYLDGTSESASINDDGTIAATTDANNITSYYGYDAMGRLHSITPPAEDGLAWNPTTIDFAPVAATEFDLGAGHWRQDVRTGDGITSTYFDAFWRPAYTVTYDAANFANTADVIRQTYDFEGRTTFASYPRRMGASTDTGVHTSYNALGQAVTVQADSELGTLTTTHSYDTGFRHTTVDPKGHSTTRSFQAFDTPGEDSVTKIQAPLSLVVDIARDVFGKTTSITRGGNGGSATRSYVYDQYERLCKTSEPETGAELVDYDAAGNIAWRAPGQVLTTQTCDRGSAGDTAKIVFVYDVMNRLLTTTYGDGAPTISRTYTPDGLPEKLSTGSVAWISCANEEGTCAFSGTREVRYGSGATFATQIATGSVACSNTVFGDPTPQVAKTCSYSSATVTSPASAPVTWTACSNENGTCNFSGTREVRYGSGTTFVSNLFTGSAPCSNAVFGDPTPQVAKTCSYSSTAFDNPTATLWTTNYNRRRLPTTQVLDFGDQTYTIGTGYDANGNPASLSYPSENNPIATRSVDYAPDALGRPTRVGKFAANVQYYPGGAISGFTYGNGIQHSLLQNARGLPEVAADTNVMRDHYGYDKNGNVTSIADEMQDGLGSRTMQYDDLDRLWTADAPRMWGSASYQYDLLDNIRSSTVGGRSITYGYDSRNRLESLSSNTAGYSYGVQYDNRGNVTRRNSQDFVFDLGNRLRSAPNKDIYVYDGFGRRVQIMSVDGTVTVSVYSPQGQLLYTRRTGGSQPAQSTEYIYLHQHQIAEVKR